jgi:beta-galactosidase
MKNKAFFIILLGLLVCTVVQAQVSFGEAKKFNENWLFSLSDDSLSTSASYDDSKWRKLDLPHDWSVEGQLSPSLASCTGYLPGGIGWYRKHFQVTDKAARHYIYFEGASAKDCGNYLMMNLPMAKWEAAKFLHEVLEQLTEENLNYPASL